MDLYGLEMKYKWQYFLAACFFASYLLDLKRCALNSSPGRVRSGRAADLASDQT